MPLSIGVQAPDFTLKQKTANGLQDVTLSNHRGRETVVLLFFPAAFTGVCTEEMCNSVGALGDVGSQDAVVYGISTDSPFAQEAWAKHAEIKVPLLSDFKHEVIKAYDVVWPNLAGLGPSAARAAFVVGRDGVIKYAEQTSAPSELPDFGKIKAALETA